MTTLLEARGIGKRFGGRPCAAEGAPPQAGAKRPRMGCDVATDMDSTGQ